MRDEEGGMQNSELSPPPPANAGGCQSRLLLWRQRLCSRTVKESVERSFVPESILNPEP